MSKNEIVEKTYNFALKIVKLVRILPKDVSGYALGKQLIRSGTSVGANVEEAQGASSKKDFVNKMNIAKKEARETRYWLNLMMDSGILSKSKVLDVMDECNSIVNILTAIVKTSTHNS